MVNLWYYINLNYVTHKIRQRKKKEEREEKNNIFVLYYLLLQKNQCYLVVVLSYLFFYFFKIEDVMMRDFFFCANLNYNTNTSSSRMWFFCCFQCIIIIVLFFGLVASFDSSCTWNHIKYTSTPRQALRCVGMIDCNRGVDDSNQIRFLANQKWLNRAFHISLLLWLILI